MSIQAVVLFYFVVVILPVLFWIWFFRKLDKKDPEPKSMLRKIFQFGLLAILLAFFAELFIDGFLGVDQLSEQYTETGFPVLNRAFFFVALSFFLAGPIEELMKYLLLKRAIFKSPHFNQIADGIIYGVTLALGFSFFENTNYFIDLYGALPKDEFAITVIIRGITATLLHVSVTGITGFYIGLEKFSRGSSKMLSWKGVFIASMLHGLYNIIIFFPGGLWVNFFLVLCTLSFLVYQLRKKEVLKIWLLSK